MIRRMRWWDLQQVHAIEAEAFGPDAWSQEQFWAELARVPESRWYVVATPDESPDLVIGYAGMFVAGDAADIQTVATAAGSRRSGIARALVAALVQRARDQDLRSIHLEVAAGNEPARRLYESAGFTAAGRRRDYYGPGRDAELMSLVLP